jgi:hypothetical protein
MQSTQDQQEVDQMNTGSAREQEHAGLIFRHVVDEVLERVDERIAELERYVAAEARVMASRIDRRPSTRGRFGGRVVVLGATSLLLSVVVWQKSDSDTVRTMLVRWAPLFFSNSWSPSQSQDSPDAGRAAVRQAATESAPPQPESSPPAADDKDAGDNQRPNAVSPYAEMMLLIHNITRDLASLEKSVEQLKLGQDQMNQIGRDNANAVQQIQAGQGQLLRLMSQSGQRSQPIKTAAPGPSQGPAAIQPSRRAPPSSLPGASPANQ